MHMNHATVSSPAAGGVHEISTWPAEVRALLEELRRDKPVRRCRRRHPRKPYFAQARMWQGETPIAARAPGTRLTLDINPYALAFICPTPPDPGDPVVIGVREPNRY